MPTRSSRPFAFAALLALAASPLAGCGARSDINAPPSRTKSLGFVTAKVFPASGNDAGRRLAVDASGDVYLTGYFGGSIDFGGGALVANGDDDVLLVKLDSKLGHVYSKSFGDADTPAGGDRGITLAVAPNGEVVVGGFFDGTVDFGNGPLTALGGVDGFLMRRKADGSPLSSVALNTSPGGSVLFGAATDSAGNALIAGYFQPSIKIGGAVLGSAGGNDIVLAKLDAQGNASFAQRAGGGGDDFASDVAVSPAGDLYVAASVTGGTDIGCGPIDGAGDVNAVIERLSAEGVCLWSHALGGTGADLMTRVAVAPDGSIVGVGSFSTAIDFGGGATSSQGKSDAFVVKLDATGKVLWGHALGGSDVDEAHAVTVDSSGNIYVAGVFTGSATFGAQTLQSRGKLDMFVTKLDASGQIVSTLAIGGDGDDALTDIVRMANGDLLVTGAFGGAIDFGDGKSVAPQGAADVFLLEITP